MGQSSSPIIRQAVASDAEDIRSCAELAYERFVPLIGQKPAPMVAEFSTQISAGIVHIATDDSQRLLGFIVFYTKGHRMFLENVAVFPDVAGHGIGKALICFCEKQARERGCDHVQLYTNEKMSENLSLYPALGYVEVERRTEDGFARVYFHKPMV